MDITTFITQGREKALLYGDHSTYHTQLSKRLLGCRKKLGIVTKNRGKFQKKDAVTAENIAENAEYLHLLLLTSERAWAQAMSMKTIHSNGPKGIVGRTRSHIISRLDKAARCAQHLVDILSDTAASGANAQDILEAKGYTAVIRGSKLFECQSWQPCLENYSTARVIYSALSSKGNADLYKDLLSETIDPSIRYAAYQLKTPRTVPIPAIARKAFPQSDSTLVAQVNEVEPGALTGQLDAGDGLPSGEDTPRTLTWRSREVKIEDAQIALAWAKVKLAKTALGANLSKQSERAPHQVAASYDEILTATQDAVDTTKQAIDEMRGEGVAQSDPRMQSLQITRTAVNYEMISWRIGRNRVLTGEQDGAVENYASKKKAKKTEETAESDEHKLKDASASKKLTKLKEKVALYEGTLQNIQSIKELPGVAADEGLSAKLAAFESYFKSLKALAIARSHAITDNASNALALIQYAFNECQKASQLPKDSEPAASTPVDIEVTSASVNILGRLIHGELQRYRAIVHIDNLRSEQKSHSSTDKVPLAERLHTYPIDGADITNIAEFPPKKSFIPMKPLFLDIAWNYINYPSKQDKGAAQPSPVKAAASKEAQEQKRGWFGFGR